MPSLEEALGSRVRAGGRAFVPYVTGGAPGFDAGLLRALEAAGADAVEVGIPFSDPVMDGGVIQEASRLALEAGATPGSVLTTIGQAALRIPVAVMTYANPVWRLGHEAFLARCVDAGVSGAIVPDLPVDEAGPWMAACAAIGVAPVFLAAPGTSDERLREVAAASRGFVYCVATYGVTGERESLSGTAQELVSRLRPLTGRPLLVGVGIGAPEQAALACAFADGVVVGSALVRPLLVGDRTGALELAERFRAAIAA
ncbi:MAG TPA: tryptophan synthase subunit alpha [Actinomycetota bacterium]|nr:tryptophan synthase subunit alpha [Actinomycetota bacterium]